MANRITNNPITSVFGFLLVALGLTAYYLEINEMVCLAVVMGGLGLMGAKDTMFTSNRTNNDNSPAKPNKPKP